MLNTKLCAINMDNSPSSSIEKQIDHFLEHFKRSASKAIDAEWGSGSDISNGQSGSPQRQQPLQRLLQRAKSRSSCLDISALSGKSFATQYKNTRY